MKRVAFVLLGIFFLVVLAVFVAAYPVAMVINSNTAFNTVVYHCQNSVCSVLDSSAYASSSGNPTSYTINNEGPGTQYFARYDYVSDRCYAPHGYINSFTSSTSYGPHSYSITFAKKANCDASIASWSFKSSIKDTESEDVNVTVNSPLTPPVGGPQTIPASLHYYYSANAAVMLEISNGGETVYNETQNGDILAGSTRQFNFSKSGLAPGTYTLKITVNANDCACSSYVTNIRQDSFTVLDTTAPAITIESPLNQSYAAGTTTIWFNVTLSETGDTCYYNLDSIGNISMSNDSLTHFYASNTSMSSGSHSVIFWCNDTAGNGNSTSVMFEILADITPPTVHLVSPANNTITSTASQTFSCNITDNIQIANLSLYVWNSTNSNIHTNTTTLIGTSNSTSFAYSLPYEDVFKWNCLGYDTSSNNAWAEEGNYTLTLDTTAPSLEIISPTNTTYNNATQLVNISSDGDNVWFTNASGQNETYTTPVYRVWNEGSNTLHAYANDSAGNLNSTSVVFTVDTTAPTVHLVSPVNNTNTNQASQTFTCNITDDTAIANLTLFIWNSTDSNIHTNTTALTGTSNSTSYAYTLPYEDVFKWNCLVYDSVSNNAWSQEGNYTITLDTTAPIVTLISPSDGYSTTETSMTFSYNVTDSSGIANCSLILNGLLNQTNTSITKNTEQNFIKTLAVGNYNWSINCTDEAGNIGNSSHRSLSISEGVGGVVYGRSGGGCVTTWTCTEWSDCIGGIQTRTCSKLNPICYANPKDKPTESQSCTVPEEEVTEETTPANETTTPEEETEETPPPATRPGILGAVIGVLGEPAVKFPLMFIGSMAVGAALFNFYSKRKRWRIEKLKKRRNRI